MSNETEEQIKLEQPKKPSRISWNTVALLFSTLAIIILIFVFSLSYSQLITVNISLADQLTNLQNEMAVYQNQTDKRFLIQSKTISEAAQTQQDSKGAWQILEASHFVTLANNNLQLTNDITLAANMLRMADQEIQSINDANLEPVKQALAIDREKLKNASVVNVSQLYARLLTMNDRIDKLPLLAKQNTTENASVENSDATQPWWRRGWQATLKTLQHIVLIRHNKAGIMPLITAEERALFYQSIRALLIQTTWALLHQQSDVYYGSLQQIISWVEIYFAPDSPETKAVLSSLIELQQTDIHPVAPELTSVHAFQNYFAATQKGV